MKVEPKQIPKLFSATVSLLFWAISLTLSLVLLWIAFESRAYEQRGVAWGPEQAGFAASGGMIGINAALQDEPYARLEQSLAIIRDGGYSWVRQRFPWKEIEPARGVYNWERWDRIVAAYRNAGLRVIALLDQPPGWSRQDNNWPNRPPDDFEEYARFVAAFVARYQGQIEHIQVWDEPNIFPNWGNRAVDAADYVRLLKAAYRSAKAANPAVTILTAGLAPNTEKGGRNQADTLYLDAMYRSGAKEYFDILATKPYGLWYPPQDRRVAEDVANFSRIVRLREIMVANGDERKPVWAVEFGWNALPQGWKGEPSIWGQVTEEEQAIYTAEAIKRARQEWPWLQVMVLQGFGPQHAAKDPLFGFSVVDWDLTPRPVYAAVRRAVASQFAPLGWHSANSRYVRYSGNWQVAEGGMVGREGDKLTLPFVGTRADVALKASSLTMPIAVAIDGRRQSLAPQLTSNGQLGRMPPSEGRARITLASGLDDSDHVLELEVMGIGDGAENGETVIEAFYVIRDVPLSATELLIACLLALSVASLMRLAISAGWLYQAARPAFAVVVGPIERFVLAIGALPDRLIIVGIVVSLSALYFVSAMPIALLGLLAYLALAILRPDLGVLFVVLAAPFYLLPKRIGNLQFAMVEILILTCLVALVLRLIISRLFRKSGRSKEIGLAAVMPLDARNGFAVPVLLFALAGLLSLTAAERVHEGLREFRTIILEPVIFYWLLKTCLKRSGVLRLAEVLVVAGVVVATIGIYQYLFTNDVITAEGVRRAKAVFGSPNNLGLFLGRVLPLAVCLGWLAMRGLKSRMLYIGAASTIAVAIGLTFSAGAWLGTASSLLFVLALRNVRLFLAAGSALAIAAAALPHVLRLERITSRFDLEQGTAALRLLIWQAALRMLQDHPLLGVGPDNFLNEYPRYMLPQAWREPNLSHPHNLVLDYWLRTGLLGLVAALWLIGRFFAVALRVQRQARETEIRALTLGLMGSMVDFIVHGMLDNSYFTVDLAIIFWTSLAAVSILESDRGES